EVSRVGEGSFVGKFSRVREGSTVGEGPTIGERSEVGQSSCIVQRPGVSQCTAAGDLKQTRVVDRRRSDQSVDVQLGIGSRDFDLSGDFISVAILGEGYLAGRNLQ